LVADPLRFFALLDRLAIPHPAIRFQPPERADAAVWLVKQAGSSGGQGVRYWRIGDSPACAESYYQRYLEGLVASALFIADGSKHRLIGYNRLKAASADAGLPFLYGGAISHAPMTSLQKQRLEGIVGALVDNLGLCGVNSLDFILHEDEIYVLELNPRPTATLELYEDKFPDGAMRGHVVACLGQLPTLNPAGRGEAVRGHHIVYAEQSMLIDSLVRWPAWVKDRPSAGSQIAQGMPVCSLFAQGVTPDEVEYQFNRRLDELEKILSIYRVEH
jgi:predicted ATP-grasp superfamily ATP-dependent carboligase